MKDYYEILGVSPEAEVEVITAAYKALMRKYHPDTNKSADAEAKAKKINEAYEALKSPLQRREYDFTRGRSSQTPRAPDRPRKKQMRPRARSSPPKAAPSRILPDEARYKRDATICVAIYLGMWIVYLLSP